MSLANGSLNRRGLMLVLSSPSGAGKSTLANLLLSDEDKLVLSISATTRAKRSTEQDGVHYHFLDKLTFENRIKEGKFLEWAQVHDNYYGTPKDVVEQSLANGNDVLFDIDVKGKRQLSEKMPDDVVSIFIMPPSVAEMHNRLTKRAEDSEEAIKRRMQTAVSEVEAWQAYDYVLVNDRLSETLEQIKAILRAERQKRTRQQGLLNEMSTFIEDLKKKISQ
ncbi:guanylate kinase [Polycladidibacter stylochi]|uniref:guanylate kinase n=1 Tax=Polycladidibacter stylochi TaxID=1807766 RepID=UPI00082CE236|nr:guanylate kinase [Pseudovibrio stylochi]